MQGHLTEDEHRNIYHSPSAEKKTDIDNTLANTTGSLFYEFCFWRKSWEWNQNSSRHMFLKRTKSHIAAGMDAKYTHNQWNHYYRTMICSHYYYNTVITSVVKITAVHSIMILSK